MTYFLEDHLWSVFLAVTVVICTATVQWHINSHQLTSAKYWYHMMDILCHTVPDRKVHGAHVGPIWGRQDPGGPHVGPMNLAIWGISREICPWFCCALFLLNYSSWWIYVNYLPKFPRVPSMVMGQLFGYKMTYAKPQQNRKSTKCVYNSWDVLM